MWARENGFFTEKSEMLNDKLDLFGRFHFQNQTAAQYA